MIIFHFEIQNDLISCLTSVFSYLSTDIADSATILLEMVNDSANITDFIGKYKGLKWQGKESVNDTAHISGWVNKLNRECWKGFAWK